MDDILFAIGLSFTSTKMNYRRKWINRPITVSIISIIFISFGSVCQTVKDYEHAVELGDLGHMMKIKLQVNVGKIFSGIMVIMFQWINYYNYKRGVKLEFISLFQAICGTIKPKSIGIDRMEFNEIKNLANKYFIILKYQNNYVIPSAGMTVVLVLYFIKGKTSMIIPYGLVHCFTWMLFGRTFFNVVTNVVNAIKCSIFISFASI